MYVYLLKCADKSYYTGVTNDLDRRLIEHNEGYNPNCYTYSRRPLKLVYSQICSTPQEAINLEKRIKGWSRAKKEALITRNWSQLHELSTCKNTSKSTNYKKS